MNDKLIRLQQISQVINHERNLLNEQLQEYEKILNELNLGIRCHINIGSDVNIKRKLGYTKEKGVWGLYVQEDDMVWQVTKAPGHLRIQITEHLESFLDHFLEAAKKHMERTIKATEKVKELNEKLRISDE